MRIFEFQEQEHFTYDKFRTKINSFTKLDEEDIQKVLKELELSHCLKHYIPEQDYYETIASDSFDSSNKEYYKFTFVGIIIVEDYVFLVYPKYWKSIESQNRKVEKFTQILAVIDKYNKSRKLSDIGKGSPVGSDRISNSIHILKEYLKSGLYWNEEIITAINGEGQIDWEKTIDENVAYLSDEIPIYLDLFTQTSRLNETDIIRRLHASIITEIYEEIHGLLGYIGLDFNFKLTNDKISDFGSSNYLLHLIDREQAGQFVSDRKIMLTNMKNYIIDKFHKPTKEMQIYGSTSFNLVWEQVCSVVYKNSLDKDMSSLGLLRDEEFPLENLEGYSWERFKLKNYIEKPRWIKGSQSVESQKSFVLDTLTVDSKTKKFRIYDAKYYKINFCQDENLKLKISHQPGVADITKQYLYQLSFRNLAKANGYRFSSSFVFPKDDLVESELPEGIGKGVILGYANMRMLSRLDLVDITLLARDCYTIYKQYLEEKVY